MGVSNPQTHHKKKKNKWRENTIASQATFPTDFFTAQLIVQGWVNMDVTSLMLLPGKQMEEFEKVDSISAKNRWMIKTERCTRNRDWIQSFWDYWSNFPAGLRITVLWPSSRTAAADCGDWTRDRQTGGFVVFGVGMPCRDLNPNPNILAGQDHWALIRQEIQHGPFKPSSLE